MGAHIAGREPVVQVPQVHGVAGLMGDRERLRQTAQRQARPGSKGEPPPRWS